MQFPTLGNSTGKLWRQCVDTPAVIIDLAVVERNILRAQSLMDSHGVSLRPHIKTHKMSSIARAQIAAGARGITVQKLGEAEIMADAGIDDILISYNIVGDEKLARLFDLTARVRLAVVADSDAVVAGLARWAGKDGGSLSVLVECDTGMRRCGVANPEDAAQLASRIARTPGLSFGGLLTYPLPQQRKQVNQWLAEAERACKSAGHSPRTISSGGTPDLFDGPPDGVVTEYRVGTYVYNDRSLISRGSCLQQDCALTVWSTVVSANSADRAVIDAGSKVLTSDLLGMADYGLVVGRPDISISGLSEEHGHLRLAPDGGPLFVGQPLRIVPNHACVVSNLVDQVCFVRGDYLVGFETVTARGKVQ